MRYEGRILEKKNNNKVPNGSRIWNIMIEMHYERCLSWKKTGFETMYFKKDNSYDFFDPADPVPMLEICSYRKMREIPNKRAEEEGLETYFRFEDMLGNEAVILEILHRYMEQYPEALFYIDNSNFYTKADIDRIYTLSPLDVEWIYKNPKEFK